jgi:hypothetical protein
MTLPLKGRERHTKSHCRPAGRRPAAKRGEQLFWRGHGDCTNLSFAAGNAYPARGGSSLAIRALEPTMAQYLGSDSMGAGVAGRRRRWAPRNNSGLRCQEIALPRTCFLGFALNLVSIAVNHQKIPLDSPTSVSRVFFCIGGIAQAARQQFPVLKDYSGGVTLRRSGQCIESSGHGNS